MLGMNAELSPWHDNEEHNTPDSGLLLILHIYVNINQRLSRSQSPHFSSPLGVCHSLVIRVMMENMCHLSGNTFTLSDESPEQHDAKIVYFLSAWEGDIQIFIQRVKSNLKYTDKIDVMTSLRRVSWVLTSGDGWWPVARIQTPVPNVGSNVPGSRHPCYLSARHPVPEKQDFLISSYFSTAQ